MLRVVGFYAAELLMRVGSRLAVAVEPPDMWPLDHTTDSCLRCQDAVVMPAGEFVATLMRAASGEPIDQLRVDVNAVYRITGE